MRRIGKWIAIMFALIVGALAVLFFVKPDTLLVPIIILAILLNPGPPQIAQGQITDKDWLHWDEAGRKLTAVLERKFPNGTPESNLKSVLLKQGFHPVRPPPADCLPPGQSAPVGVVFTTCLTADQEQKRQRTLEYTWGNGICGEYVRVDWSADNQSAITHVEGSYFGACL